jgi:hypothetical protein
MVHNGQTKCFPNWFNGCDNLYMLKKLNDYFHMLKAFKWHCDWGGRNCTQNTFLWHKCVHMFMVVYVQHLIFIELNIKWIVRIFGEIMINTKWGPKPNGSKFNYTKIYNPKICGPSCGWEYQPICVHCLVVNLFK